MLTLKVHCSKSKRALVLDDSQIVLNVARWHERTPSVDQISIHRQGRGLLIAGNDGVPGEPSFDPMPDRSAHPSS
jgi:hypothetical protein